MCEAAWNISLTASQRDTAPPLPPMAAAHQQLTAIWHSSNETRQRASLYLENQVSYKKINRVGLTLIPFVNATGYFSQLFTDDEPGAELLCRSCICAFSALTDIHFIHRQIWVRAATKMSPKPSFRGTVLQSLLAHFVEANFQAWGSKAQLWGAQKGWWRVQKSRAVCSVLPEGHSAGPFLSPRKGSTHQEAGTKPHPSKVQKQLSLQ